MDRRYILKNLRHQKVLFSPMKLDHFIPESGSEIHVKNLPFDSTIEELTRFCEKAGPIYQVRLMMHDDSGRNRGFAFVTYMNSTLAERAVGLLKKTKYRKGYLSIEKSFDNCRIFLGGIPTNKTKNEIWMELIKLRIPDIVDVIMYRSYSDRAVNRGFVFVEFRTHEQAANFRARFRGRSMVLWGQEIIVDWSVPIPRMPEEDLKQVKKLFLRNLYVCQTPQELRRILFRFIDVEKVEKVFKFKNFAFIHLTTKEDAIYLMDKLKAYYKGTPVEVDWARPPDKYTTAEYRQNKISDYSHSRPHGRRYNRSPSSSRPSTSFSVDVSDGYSSPSNFSPTENSHCDLMQEVNHVSPNCNSQDLQWMNHFSNMTIQDWSICLSNNATGEFIDLYQFIGDIFS